MKITSATFMRGLIGDNEILHDGIPQVAFIGRSNAGKSSMLNTLTNQRKLARTSNTPGRTQEINVFLINDSHYFLDLPGYAFARTKMKVWQKLDKLISWYLFRSENCHRVVLLIDAEIGPTHNDLDMLAALTEAGKDIIIVLNKVDKIKKSHYLTQITKLKKELQGYVLVPFSSETRVGVDELTELLLAK
jgi:GTP-binding protein